MRVLQPWGKAAALGMQLRLHRGRFSTHSHALSVGIARRAASQRGASAAEQPPSLWAVLQRVCCQHQAGWEGKHHDHLSLQFLL